MCYDTAMVAARKELAKQTRLRIRIAAEQVMRRDGFAATTIREIATAAGVSVGSVLVHYGSKEDLLYELFFEQIDTLVAASLTEAERIDGLPARLRALAGGLIEGYAADPRVSADVLRHALFAEGAWGERFRGQTHDAAIRVAGWYREAIAAGEARSDLDVEAAVLTFMSAYYFLLLDLVKNDFAETATALARLNAILDLHWKGLRIETRQARQNPRKSRRP